MTVVNPQQELIDQNNLADRLGRSDAVSAGPFKRRLCVTRFWVRICLDRPLWAERVEDVPDRQKGAENGPCVMFSVVVGAVT